MKCKISLLANQVSREGRMSGFYSMARKQGSDFTVPNHDVGNNIRFKGRLETPYLEISERFGRNERFLLSSFSFKSFKAKG